MRSGTSNVLKARTAADVHRKKILQYVNALSEHELEKVSEMLATSDVAPAQEEETPAEQQVTEEKPVE